MAKNAHNFTLGVATILLYSFSVDAAPHKTGWRPMPEEHRHTINQLQVLRKVEKQNLRNIGQMAPKVIKETTPDLYDLSPACTVLDQGSLGSCVINAFSGSVQSLQVLDQFKRQGGKIDTLQTKAKVKDPKIAIPVGPKHASSKPTNPTKPQIIAVAPDISVIKKQVPLFSRLFGYRDVIGMQGDISDTGTDAGTAFLSYNRGWSYEATYPYKVGEFASTPSKLAYTEAALNASKLRVNVALVPTDKNAPAKIESLIAAGKFVMIAINVFESFESEVVLKTGIVPTPKKGEKFLGGHEMAIVGYDRKNQRALVRNSWGKSWGLGGYCWIPYALVADPNFTLELMQIKLASDT